VISLAKVIKWGAHGDEVNAMRCTENYEFIRFIIEVTISVIALIAITLLKWNGSIDERTFLIALVLWGLFFPSPNQWAITIGDWLSARKNGKVDVRATNPKQKVSDTEGEAYESDNGVAQ